MLPDETRRGIDAYLAAADKHAAGQVAGLYVVGSVALGDFSHRQSNIDLLVVTEPALDPEQLKLLSNAHGQLRRAGREPGFMYTTWEAVAGGPGAGMAVAFRGATREAPGEGLCTPMTWGILRQDPMVVRGPDWPVVWHDPDAYSAWCARSIGAVAARTSRLLFRRHVVPSILEVARLAHGAATGEVLSKCEAGEWWIPRVTSRFQRVLKDAVGYRRGAQTSMYWGPFERRNDAIDLVRMLTSEAAKV